MLVYYRKVSFRRMQHFDQNKEDFVYPVYLFRFATKAKIGELLL